ncbi:hypothetical protein [Dyella koreensis]|uniref:Uncharacterized protein n=1 Tax=Dyella koreensis TaxID=311235 RepID=A0ABW8K0A9_9GAMM
MSSLWTDLLFLHGHIASPELARRLADVPTPQDKPRGSRERIGTPLKVHAASSVQAQITPCGKACAPA